MHWYACINCRGGQANFFKVHKSANSWDHSAIANPQISYGVPCSPKIANPQICTNYWIAMWKIVLKFIFFSTILFYVEIWIRVFYAICVCVWRKYFFADLRFFKSANHDKDLVCKSKIFKVSQLRKVCKSCKSFYFANLRIWDLRKLFAGPPPLINC